MTDCVQWNPFTVEKNLPQVGLERRTARSAGQHLTHYQAPILLNSYTVQMRKGKTLTRLPKADLSCLCSHKLHDSFSYKAGHVSVSNITFKVVHNVFLPFFKGR